MYLPLAVKNHFQHCGITGGAVDAVSSASAVQGTSDSYEYYDHDDDD
jgi:hypothetical protein